MFDFKKKKHLQRQALEERLRLLQDALGNHEIIHFIRNSIAPYLEQKRVFIKCTTTHFTVKASNFEFGVEAIPSFEVIEDLKILKDVHYPTQDYSDFRNIIFQNNLVSTIDVRETKSDTKTHLKAQRNVDINIYSDDILISKFDCRDAMDVSDEGQFDWNNTSLYFIDGDEGVQIFTQRVPEIAHPTITHPEVATKTEKGYLKVSLREPVSFKSGGIWYDPKRKEAIDKTQFNSFLKQYQDGLAVKAPTLNLKELERFYKDEFK